MGCCHRFASTLVAALSGGVDSSVAAALLQKQLAIYNVNNNNDAISLQAVHMTNWNHRNDDNQDDLPQEVVSCYDQEWKDAQQVAEHLGLSITRQHLEAEYWNHVFEPYLNDLVQKGTMGNPDVGCNVHVKFGALRQRIQERFRSNNNDQHWLATGHYARLWYHADPHQKDDDADENETSNDPRIMKVLVQNYTPLVEEHLDWSSDEWLWNLHLQRLQQQENRFRRYVASSHPWLLAAKDQSKDQSYFLAGCSSAQLSRVWFPLGNLYKKEKNKNHKEDAEEHATVRDLAAQFNLPTAAKPESMGICFVGKRKSWQHFVQDFWSPQLLGLVTFCDIETGQVLGQSDEPSHPSLFTTGRGAKLGGLRQKYFVVGGTQCNSGQPPQKSQPLNAVASSEYVVWVCAGTHHPALYADSLMVQDMNWIVLDGNDNDSTRSREIPKPLQHGGRLRCLCRIRHLQPLIGCNVTYDAAQQMYTIHFDKPLRAITPGQMLALYAAHGLVCLGGGPIAARGATYWEQGKELPETLHPSGQTGMQQMKKDQRVAIINDNEAVV